MRLHLAIGFLLLAPAAASAQTMNAERFHQRAAALQAKLMGEEFRLRQESLPVLTPEQKTQLEQRREQFKNRRGERRGGGQML